jgi:hypothetical protein
MTAAAIVGYLLVALIVGRIFSLSFGIDRKDGEDLTILSVVMIFWPLFVGGCAVYGLLQLVAAPPRRERLERRRKRTEEAIAQLEREVGL